MQVGRQQFIWTARKIWEVKGEPDTRSSTPRSAIKTHIVVVLHATLGRLEAPGHQRPLEPFEGTACNQIPFSALWGAEAYRGNEESCMDCQEDLGSEGGAGHTFGDPKLNN